MKREKRKVLLTTNKMKETKIIKKMKTKKREQVLLVKKKNMGRKRNYIKKNMKKICMKIMLLT
jgi:hypothetical protein